MAVERHFLDWEQPVLERVVDYLLPGSEVAAGMVDLSAMLVVVPTQQAGRRLRREIAVRCAAAGKAALAPRVCTPAHLLPTPAGLASPGMGLAVWGKLLAGIDLADYPALLPTPPPRQQVAWGMQTGRLLQQVRDQLLDGMLRIPQVLERQPQESERWADLARLEEEYLAALGELGLVDPGLASLTAAASAPPPDGIERVVVAAVPDASLSMRAVLGRWAGTLAVDVLVHAPVALAEAFDDWGAPLPEAWATLPIEIADEAIFLESNPTCQARRVVDRLAVAGAAPTAVAIGAPDSEVAAALVAEFAARGSQAFDPAAKPLAEQPLARLLEAVEALSVDRHYEWVAAFLRHPDVLDCLARRGCAASQLLAELDGLRQEHLPESFEALAWFAGQVANSATLGAGKLAMPAAITLVKNVLEALQGGCLATALRRILAELYDGRLLDGNRPADQLWQATATAINGLLDQLADAEQAMGLTAADGWALLRSLLAHQTVALPRDEATIEIEGWLELAWNAAPTVVVAGLNEGIVPDGRVDDAFLPDSLRQRLGLRRDATRLARDAYLLRSILAVRGRSTSLVLGKYSLSGDPLKPSRLLFRCADDQLPGRVRLLTGDPPVPTAIASPGPGFRLRLPTRAELPPQALELGSVSASRLRDYLACPFRYYLKRVLKMQADTDEVDELDALHYGTLLHAALESLGEIPACGDPGQIERHLLAALQEQAERRYGGRRSFLVDLQIDSARERLAAAAVEQAKAVREGWRIVDIERSLEGLGQFEIRPGVKASGRIDRIERRDGPDGQPQYRILDYKSSETSKSPAATHFATGSGSGQPEYCRVQCLDGKGKLVERRWVDLQLPLYALAWRQAHAELPAPACGYFNLSSSQTSIELLAEIEQPEVLEQALACAQGVVDDLRRGRFWPPAAKIAYDDFERIFPFRPEECVDHQAAFDAEGVLR